MGQLIRIIILSWSAALLTASYAGMFTKMDPTFIATVFTASAATFGINTMKKSGEDDDEKKKLLKEMSMYILHQNLQSQNLLKIEWKHLKKDKLDHVQEHNETNITCIINH